MLLYARDFAIIDVPYVLRQSLDSQTKAWGLEWIAAWAGDSKRERRSE